MNTRRKPISRVYLLLGLGLVVLALLASSTAQAQGPRPTRVAPPTRLTPLRPPLRATPTPTPFTPAAPCIHLTTDGTPGSSFVGGRISERCFAFPGDAGAVVSIRLSARTATPAMELRGPDGQVAARSTDGEILDLELTLDGSYAVLVSGRGMPQSVRVELTVTAAVNPTVSSSLSGAAEPLCGGSLTPGLVTNGIVPFPGEDCRFTFQGQRGQAIGLRMDSLAPDLAPDLVLMDPNGAVLDTGHALGSQASYVSALRLPATGLYSVTAASQNDQSAGAFKLALWPVQTATCGDTIALGQKVELTLPAGEAACDLWVDVSEERLLAGNVTALDGAPAPTWQLLDPQATVVASDQDAAWFAESTGQYVLRLYAAAGYPTRVLLEVAPPPYQMIYIVTSCGANLTYGQSPGFKAFELGLTGNTCLFNFNGSAGNLVWVAVSRSSAATAFDPVIELMAPGYQAADAPEAVAYSGQVPGMTVLRDHPLARSGRYTVRITDYGNDDPGNFYIMVWKR